MSERGRRWVSMAAAAVLASLLAWAISGLPSFGQFRGPYGRLLNEIAVQERRVTNVVAAVLYDYRALDTLVEELVLLASVTGVGLLLRRRQEETEERPDEELPGREVPATSEAVRMAASWMAGLTVLYGLYLIVHGHLTPGGGFQGGIVLGSAPLLVYLATDHRTLRRLVPLTLLEVAESAAVGVYVLLGLVALAVGSFLANFLPLGAEGALLSGGTIPLLNLVVGLAVAVGLVLLISEFLEQTLILREGRTGR